MKATLYEVISANWKYQEQSTMTTYMENSVQMRLQHTEEQSNSYMLPLSENAKNRTSSDPLPELPTKSNDNYKELLNKPSLSEQNNYNISGD